jgi:hypothetical protein
LARRNKGSGLKMEFMVYLKAKLKVYLNMKKGCYPRRIKPRLPLRRNQVRRRGGEEDVTYAVRRATSPPFVQVVTHPTLS